MALLEYPGGTLFNNMEGSLWRVILDGYLGSYGRWNPIGRPCHTTGCHE